MKNRDSSHYQRIWRWHFYAGLFVAPFLILLSLTGIVYLFKPQLDNLMYPELMKVAPASQTLSADQLLAKAMMTMPDASLRKYLPPAAPDQSAQFIVNQGDRELTLFMDPASGALLGTMDNKWNLQSVARRPAARHHRRSADRTGCRLGAGTAAERPLPLVATQGARGGRHPLAQSEPARTSLVAGSARCGRLLGSRFPAAIALERHDLDRLLG